MAEMTPERLAKIEARADHCSGCKWCMLGERECIHQDKYHLELDLTYGVDIPDMIAALRKAWAEVEHARKELVFEAQQHMAEVMGCKTNGHIPDERMTSCVNCRATLYYLSELE